MNKQNVFYGNYYNIRNMLVACRIFPERESRKASKREIKKTDS